MFVLTSKGWRRIIVYYGCDALQSMFECHWLPRIFESLRRRSLGALNLSKRKFIIAASATVLANLVGNLSSLLILLIN